MAISTLTYTPVNVDVVGQAASQTGAGSISFSAFIGNTKAAKVAVGDGIHCDFQVPHGWDQTSFTPHVHFSIGTSGAGSKVKFHLEYCYQNSSLVWPAAASTDDVETSVATTTTHQGYVANFAAITPANYNVAQLIRCIITRVAASATEFEGDVFLDYFDLHFPCGKIGTT